MTNVGMHQLILCFEKAEMGIGPEACTTGKHEYRPPG